MNGINDMEAAYFGQYEFKGMTIEAPSKLRNLYIISLMDLEHTSMMDVFAFLYGCLCPVHTLIKGRRKREWFDEQVNAWIEENKLGMEDLPEATEVMKAIMNDASRTRAEAVESGEVGAISGN